MELSELPYTINIKGRLFSFKRPQVMGIVNLTPDSFYAPSRMLQDEEKLEKRIRQIADEGGTMVDIGAYSSRPGAVEVSVEEEMERLRTGLQLITKVLPEGIVMSVDTFRSDVAKMCVEEYGVSIINDISGGEMDEDMFTTISSLHVPYVLMYSKNGINSASETLTNKGVDIIVEEFRYFSKKINILHEMGVADIIVDPGFGFSKTREQDFILLKNLRYFSELGCPVLAGISRKRMVYETLHCDVENALEGTIAANTIALMNCANILRVHDVKAAVSAVKMVEMSNS